MYSGAAKRALIQISLKARFKFQTAKNRIHFMHAYINNLCVCLCATVLFANEYFHQMREVYYRDVIIVLHAHIILSEHEYNNQ